MKNVLSILIVLCAMMGTLLAQDASVFDAAFKKPKLYGIVHTHTYLMCKDRAVSFFPSFGGEYTYDSLFTPGLLIGVGIYQGEPFAQSTDVYIKTKLKPHHKMYFKQGVWCLCRLHRDGAPHRFYTYPKATIGIDLDNLAFAEFNVILSSAEISRANFGLASGVRF